MANPTIRRIKCVLGTAIGNQIIPLVTLIIIDIPVVFDKQFCQLKNCSADNSLLSMTSCKRGNGLTLDLTFSWENCNFSKTMEPDLCRGTT